MDVGSGCCGIKNDNRIIMKKKNAIILIVVNAIYLALVFYVKGTLYPDSEDFRFLIAFLCFIINGFTMFGISIGVYNDDN